MYLPRDGDLPTARLRSDENALVTRVARSEHTDTVTALALAIEAVRPRPAPSKLSTTYHCGPPRWGNSASRSARSRSTVSTQLPTMIQNSSSRCSLPP